MLLVDWTKGQIPRFHPVVGTYGSETGWFVADGLQTMRNNRTPVSPYINAPCESREEAEELAIVLNETEPDPRPKDEDDVRTTDNSGPYSGP